MIDSYRFGRMAVDGIVYTSDLVILPGCVHPNWWRKQGHNLCIDDLAGLIDAVQLTDLIVGTGKFGLMKIEEEFFAYMQENSVTVHPLPTSKAADLFNSLIQTDAVCAGAFHLTC